MAATREAAMTVGDLIKELQRYDSNLIVIVSDEDYRVPQPDIIERAWECHYWDEYPNQHSIPKHQEHVIL